MAVLTAAPRARRIARRAAPIRAPSLGIAARRRLSAYDDARQRKATIMKGKPEIIDALNDILTGELTAVNQYFL
ncbi:MAG TPA: hypothetical protein VGG33_29295, partial [Polyangia bacterium]